MRRLSNPRVSNDTFSAKNIKALSGLQVQMLALVIDVKVEDGKVGSKRVW